MSRKLIIILLLVLLVLNITGCAIQKTNKDTIENQVKPNTELTKNMADWAVELFKETYQEGENLLISPTSVLMALSMTANGADNETLAQMEKVLGRGLTIDEINKSIAAYLKKIEDVEDVHIANSIWINAIESLKIKDEFVNTNKKYYNAEIYSEVFSDKTADKINNWVDKNTHGMINKLIDNISPQSIMYLINAIAFESEWEEEYAEYHVFDDIFTNHEGEEKNIEMMFSEEDKYFDDGKAIGFIKLYKDNKFSFVAILPNEDVELKDYISEMSGEGLSNLISSYRKAKVDAYLPKFTYSYDIKMKDVLVNMGIVNAFNEFKADFSKIADAGAENIYINQVIHKTFIEVDEKGTKAAAVTGVEMNITSAVIDEERYIVRLDRPFIYMIIDNETNTPLFMGVVTDIGE